METLRHPHKRTWRHRLFPCVFASLYFIGDRIHEIPPFPHRRPSVIYMERQLIDWVFTHMLDISFVLYPVPFILPGSLCADVAGRIGLPHCTSTIFFFCLEAAFIDHDMWCTLICPPVYFYYSSGGFVWCLRVKILWWKDWVVVFWWLIESFGRHWWKALGWHSGFLISFSFFEIGLLIFSFCVGFLLFLSYFLAPIFSFELFGLKFFFLFWFFV